MKAGKERRLSCASFHIFFFYLVCLTIQMPTTLVQLVQRAASISKPYNCQDAVLLIKALSALRLRQPEVRSICEKACFSLASSPREVAAPVVVDVVNHLATLQSSHLPVVQRVLMKRFCELPLRSERSSSTPAVDPRTAQKAALALIKLGRSASSEAVVEHVLRLLHALLSRHAQDVGLHIAYVALYPYSARYTAAQPPWWLAPPPHKPSVVTLTTSLRFLLEHPQVYTRASGNVAWQLFHMLLLLPPAPSSSSSHAANGYVCGLPCDRIRDFEAYCRSGALAGAVSAGAYVTFLQTFCADLCSRDLERACLLLSGVFLSKEPARAQVSTAQSDYSLRRINVYDATKLAGAVAQTLAAIGPSLPLAASSGTTYDAAASPPQAVQPDVVTTELPRSDLDARTEAVRLSLCVLDSLVLWQQQLWQQSRVAPVSASMTLLEEHSGSPDSLLVASLLHAYAKATRSHHAHPSVSTDAAVRVLLSFVPELANTTPVLLSWMLASLAAMAANIGKSHSLAAAAAHATQFLLRQYMRFSARTRSLRTDVEALYGCMRIRASLCQTCQELSHVSSQGRTSLNEGRLHDRQETSALQRRWALEVEDNVSHTTTSFASARQLTVLLQDTALRLRSARTQKTSAVSREDVDELLAMLVDVHSTPLVTSASTANDDNEKADEPPFMEAVAHLQVEVLDCVDSSFESADDGTSENVCLRTARLCLLSNLTASLPAAARDRFAYRLRVLQLLHLQHFQHSAEVKVSSALMLRCLALLAQDPSPNAETRHLLSVLCSKYQATIQACVQAAPQRLSVEGVVRVLRRARLAGVCVVLESTAEGTRTRCDSAHESSEKDSEPTLAFPMELCHAERLTTYAAADLLLLLSDSFSSSSAHPPLLHPEQRSALHQVASSLVTQLQRTPSVECTVRLLQASKSPAASLLLFPDTDDLFHLLCCTNASVTQLLSCLEGEAVAGGQADWHARQASRLLVAVANFPLFFTPPLSTRSEGGTLRGNLLRLAQHVERHGCEADDISVLKIKLLCEGIV